MMLNEQEISEVKKLLSDSTVMPFKHFKEVLAEADTLHVKLREKYGLAEVQQAVIEIAKEMNV